MIQTLPRVVFSVSYTTRQPRQGETDGVDYHFVSRSQFEKKVEEGFFLEYAEVHGYFYGTSLALTRDALEQGVDVVLDIDVKGADIVRDRSDFDAVFVFIAAPSFRDLENRLRARETESQEDIDRRLKNARIEMQAVEKYEYLVVNVEVEKAAELLSAIVVAERAKTRRFPSGEPITGLLEP